MSYLSVLLNSTALIPKPCHSSLDALSADEADVIQYLADCLCDCEREEYHAHPIPHNHAPGCKYVKFVSLIALLHNSEGGINEKQS